MSEYFLYSIFNLLKSTPHFCPINSASIVFKFTETTF